MIYKGACLMGPYIFVIATIVAIIPILIISKIAMGRIKENPEQREKIYSQFFIGIALSETIPLILIVYGFANLSIVASIKELYVPGLIIILFTIVAAFFIFLQRAVDVTEDIKGMVTTFSFIALAMITAIPIISIVALFSMIP